MNTQWTSALRGQFARLPEFGEAGADAAVEAFAKAFDEWKSAQPASEYLSYVFGLDVPYVRPPANQVNEGGFWHVHLVPLQSGEELAQWNKDFSRKTRKTSNRALVYATKTVALQQKFLLIYILQKDAHEIARMESDAHKVLMTKLAKIANIWTTKDLIRG